MFYERKHVCTEIDGQSTIMKTVKVPKDLCLGSEKLLKSANESEHEILYLPHPTLPQITQIQRISEVPQIEHMDFSDCC